jgi:hypothetical protein
LRTRRNTCSIKSRSAARGRKISPTPRSRVGLKPNRRSAPTDNHALYSSHAV